MARGTQRVYDGESQELEEPPQTGTFSCMRRPFQYMPLDGLSPVSALLYNGLKLYIMILNNHYKMANSVQCGDAGGVFWMF